MLRKNIKAVFLKYVSFEPIELTEKIMGQGASTPDRSSGGRKKYENIEEYAKGFRKKLNSLGRTNAAAPEFSRHPY